MERADKSEMGQPPPSFGGRPPVRWGKAWWQEQLDGTWLKWDGNSKSYSSSLSRGPWSSAEAVASLGAENRRLRRQLGATFFLAVLLATGIGVLAVVLVDVRRDLSDSENVLAAQLSAAEDRLGSMIDAAASRLPDVEIVRKRVDALETTLFGLGGTSYKRDVVGDLERQISELKSDVGGLGYSLSSWRRCFNSALSDSFNSYDRAVNSYLGRGTYWVSSC